MNIEQWTIGPLARRRLKFTFKSHITVGGPFTMSNEEKEVNKLFSVQWPPKF